MGLTEATGVTRITSTVIRIFTPQGTLVVEVDDPNVKVTIDGDDLVIHGAGPQEVRLRPGTYQLRATKDGQPIKLSAELITITRGGKQVVRVSREDAKSEQPGRAAQQGPFVILGQRAERAFATLDDAVTGAQSGDTIEIRGDGPFVSDSLHIETRP